MIKGVFLTAAVSLSALSATAADAATIGIFGSNSNSEIASFLTASGHTVAQNQSSVSGADYSVLDAVILLRSDGDAATAAFVRNGGILITEWSASTWALNQANLLNAADIGGNYVATNTTVSFTADGLAHGLGTDIGSSYSADGASEFFRFFGSIGAGVEVWGTRPGNNATIIAGQSGAGYVVLNGADWADSFGSSGAANQNLLLNALNAPGLTAAVPEPASWAMMLAGFGAIGGALRHRRRAVKIAFA